MLITQASDYNNSGWCCCKWMRAFAEESFSQDEIRFSQTRWMPLEPAKNADKRDLGRKVELGRQTRFVSGHVFRRAVREKKWHGL
jgi:hypothetical protein